MFVPSDHLNFKVSLAGTVKAIFPVEALQADGKIAGSSMVTKLLPLILKLISVKQLGLPALSTLTV